LGRIPVSQFDNPVGKEETNRPQRQRRDTKRETRKRRRQAGIAVFIYRQNFLKDFLKTRPHVPQAVEDNQTTDRPDDHAKKFGRFHVAVPGKAESRAAILSSRR
jgi:hypothetical protein